MVNPRTRYAKRKLQTLRRPSAHDVLWRSPSTRERYSAYIPALYWPHNCRIRRPHAELILNFRRTVRLTAPPLIEERAGLVAPLGAGTEFLVHAPMRVVHVVRGVVPRQSVAYGADERLSLRPPHPCPAVPAARLAAPGIHHLPAAACAAPERPLP